MGPVTAGLREREQSFEARARSRVCLIAIARLRSCGPRAALLPIVRLSSERARHAVRQDTSLPRSRSLPLRSWSSSKPVVRVAMMCALAVVEEQRVRPSRYDACGAWLGDPCRTVSGLGCVVRAGRRTHAVPGEPRRSRPGSSAPFLLSQCAGEEARRRALESRLAPCRRSAPTIRSAWRS
jgi:hypothetical protein